MSSENYLQKNNRKVKSEIFLALFKKVGLLSSQKGLIVWEWVKNLIDDVQNFSSVGGGERDIDANFFFAVFDSMEMDLFVKLQAELEEKNTFFAKTDTYQKFEKVMRLIAALLLYYLPEDTPASISEWRERVEKSNGVAQPSLMRFLGQAFFAGDYEVCLQLLNWSATGEPGRAELTNYYYLATIFLSWKRFDIINPQARMRVVGAYLWPALYFDIPIKRILEEVLAEESTVEDYLITSGLWAESIKNSGALLDLKNPDFTIKRFIEDFLALARGSSLDKKVQEDYLNEVVKKNGWDDSFKNRCRELLQIYLHLRECDLIDYRGLLSDVDAQRERYDWKAILSKKIDDEQRKEIKRYLTILHRPWRTKMQIIVTLESFNWKDEKFLNQALILNEIYEEVYGHFYGSLVFFDQKKGDWCLDKNFPAFLDRNDLNYDM